MRRLAVAVSIALVLGGAAVAYGSEAACPQAVLDQTGSNPSLASAAALLATSAATYGIPVQVLKAVAYRESAWNQFKPDGHPLISSDSVCGIGLMQITLGNRSDGVRLADDVAYNVDEGAKILKAKWDGLQNQTHPAPTGYPLDDPAIVENWYAAICRYNGYNGCGHAGDDLHYAEPVARIVGDPFQRGLPASYVGLMPPAGFTTPEDADATYVFPGGFQAQHSPDQFVFYDGSTGAVTKTVLAATHLASTGAPAYGAGTYGPDGPAVSCTDCADWRLAAGTGIAGWAHWTLSTTNPDVTTASWAPPATGLYAVSAHVPSLGADPLATVTYHFGSATQTVDQEVAKGANGGWVDLGQRTLSAAAPVRLGDHSGTAGVKVVADAVRMSAVTTLSLTSSVSTVTYGHATTLSIRLAQVGGAGLPGRSVTLSKRKVGGAWSVPVTYVTGTDGRVSLTARPTSNTEYRASYAAPDAATLSAPDVVRRVNVKTAVRASLSKTSVPRNTSVTVSASVLPNHAGQTVYLQRYYSGAWHNAVSKALSSSSTASFAFAKSTAGTYTYRVYKPADADHVASYSVTLTLKVT
jgi:hypothetical protein